MIRFLFVFLATISLAIAAEPLTPKSIASGILAPLLDPAKIATLRGDRPANARLYKVLGWLETARQAGGDVDEVIHLAQTAAGYEGTKRATADQAAIHWSLSKLEDFGCFTADGMAKLKKGGSPTIMKGEYAGTGIMLDHVLPRAVVPELAARFYNLEAVAAKVNLEKSAKVGSRELLLARRWQAEGLLSAEGLEAIEAVAK